MHIYFSGIGGTAIGPLALIAHKAGFEVSGSDQQASSYIDYLKNHGISDIHIGQDYEHIAASHQKKPIDWVVYTSALPIEHPDAPELQFCKDLGIRNTKRDVFLNFLLTEKKLKLIAIAGTHGKTTVTAMVIWLFKQLGIPVSYSVGGKLSFGDMGDFDPASEYFVYEADEFDRNFLAFNPYLSIITGIDWDHPDIYPTRDAYNQAFRQFINQSKRSVLWQDDALRLGLSAEPGVRDGIDENSPELAKLTLPGLVNRRNGWQAAYSISQIVGQPVDQLIVHSNRFPGVARRFEKLAENLYTDYAHTPAKIRGALQLAHEVGPNVVVVYEGLHNTRQHFIKDDLKNLFSGLKHLYIVPSYLAREDPDLPILSPDDLKGLLSPDVQEYTTPTTISDALKEAIKQHTAAGDLVIAFSAGGGHSLNEWLHQEFADL